MAILVSGASGVVGYGILKTLEDSKHTLIGTTIYEYSVASAFCDITKVVYPTDNPWYIDNLCELIDHYHVDMIIPGIECDMYKWNEERELLQKKTFPLLNSKTLIDLCRDKLRFYEKMIGSKYAIPTVSGVNYSEYPLPFLFKPRSGFGSKGIIKVTDNKNFIIPMVGDKYMTQPIIGSDDEEYTVSGFFDKRSNLIDYFPLRRKLVNGFTGEAIVEDRGFGKVLEELAEIFKPVGPTNFQFRFDRDMPKLLEINPRISSATSIRAALGYNESEMSISYFLKNKLPLVHEKPIGRRAIRYSDDLIF